MEATGKIAKVEGMKKIGNKEGREMVWVRFASVRRVEKIEMMNGKTKLRDRKKWIVDDLTEKERRID